MVKNSFLGVLTAVAAAKLIAYLGIYEPPVTPVAAQQQMTSGQ